MATKTADDWNGVAATCASAHMLAPKYSPQRLIFKLAARYARWRARKLENQKHLADKDNGYF